MMLVRHWEVKALMTLTTVLYLSCFFFSSRRRHTIFDCDWSSDVCSSDLSRSKGKRREEGREEQWWWCWWCSTVVVMMVGDRKSTRLNSSHSQISYAVFCLKKKKKKHKIVHWSMRTTK